MTPPTIPLFDMSKVRVSGLEDALAQVMDSGRFIGGAQVKSFESAFASYCSSKTCVGLSSGTAALYAALLAYNIGPGDEVITVPATFVATVSAIVHVGARPIFVDVDPQINTMDAEKLGSALSDRTRAIIPVDLYGQPSDLTPIIDIAHDQDVVVIEDAAQAHGASYGDRRVGSLADVTCFSFYPSKNLGALGDAGAITTNDIELADRIRSISNHGRTRGHHQFGRVGHNLRLDTIQAAFLHAKLAYLDDWNDSRRCAAAWYDAGLAGLPVATPQQKQGTFHVFHQYVIRHTNRDSIRSELCRMGIATGIHYPVPLHMTAAFDYLGYKQGCFPNAEHLARTCLSLPMYPGIERDQVTTVCEAIRSLLIDA